VLTFQVMCSLEKCQIKLVWQQNLLLAHGLVRSKQWRFNTRTIEHFTIDVFDYVVQVL